VALITLFLANLAVRAHRSKAMYGKEGMIGALGTAQTLISPEGKVFVEGELWNAHSGAEVRVGDRVRVVRVEGLHLEVELVEKP
jgi:membrane-bound serine protease (ClpP class)